MTIVSPAFLSELAAGLSDDALSRTPDDLAVYGRDWTKVFAPSPSIIVFPKTTAEVQHTLRTANAHGVAVVPSGGRTGLAGGAVAASGEVVLSTARMRRMYEVDLAGATVRVQAGAVTAEVHAHTAPHGLTWPVDFASKGSSHVGGNIATNAGGVKVIRYGLTRNWVLGLEVVLADGSVLDLGGALEKNNTGVDLRQLFIGSEGTLGFVTEATLKLTKLPERLDVALFAVESLSAVLALFQRVRELPGIVSAYEFFTDACLARLLSHRKVRAPFSASHPFYVLLEVEGARDFAESLMPILESGLAVDAVVAQHESEARSLWELREGISESLSATGLPHKNDIALPIAALEAFVQDLNALMATRYAGWEICLFGHIGDGNLHLNVMKPSSMEKEDFLSKTHEADTHVFDLVQKHRGSISAEHGIGLLKKDFLRFTRTPAEVELMRQMKRVLDPKGILNPGKVF
ncbi:MAG: FAD-binding oxidoreductase [Polyangiaceae bacterium]